MKRCCIPLLFTLALSGAAIAQPTLTTTESTTVLPVAPGARPGVRSFPKQALRGTMTVKQSPHVDLDDRLTQLTPGARILDQNNRNVRPASLTQRPLTVNYLLDAQGRVSQAWILSAEEAAEKRATRGVERNYSFESQQDSRIVPFRPAGAQAN